MRENPSTRPRRSCNPSFDLRPVCSPSCIHVPTPPRNQRSHHFSLSTPKASCHTIGASTLPRSVEGRPQTHTNNVSPHARNRPFLCSLLQLTAIIRAGLTLHASNPCTPPVPTLPTRHEQTLSTTPCIFNLVKTSDPPRGKCAFKIPGTTSTIGLLCCITRLRPKNIPNSRRNIDLDPPASRRPRLPPQSAFFLPPSRVTSCSMLERCSSSHLFSLPDAQSNSKHQQSRLNIQEIAMPASAAPAPAPSASTEEAPVEVRFLFPLSASMSRFPLPP